MNAALLVGHVMHQRLSPRKHWFRYPVFFMRLDLDKLDALSRSIFSVNRWNLLSFWWKDHGARDGTAPRIWIRRLLERHGVGATDGPVHLYAFPRVLGYVFNPVSFWACYDAGLGLRAVLCEVNNTFGERHNYLVTAAGGSHIGDMQPLRVSKVFHVSPFFEIRGEYSFRFRFGEDGALVAIHYRDRGKSLFVASLSGQARPWTTPQLARLLLRFPLMTILVAARIHYQALLLWLKRMVFHRKPPAPLEETSR
jgi:uncharacterized protein